MAGYSGTPLLKKLGIKDGHHVLVCNAPGDVPEELTRLAAGEKKLRSGKIDVAVLFSPSSREFKAGFSRVARQLDADGALWIAWPKKSSGVKTDMTENAVRDYALTTDFVDVKVCAIDETWSGLKLVVRKERRGTFAAKTLPAL